LPPEVNG